MYQFLHKTQSDNLELQEKSAFFQSSCNIICKTSNLHFKNSNLNCKWQKLCQKDSDSDAYNSDMLHILKDLHYGLGNAIPDEEIPYNSENEFSTSSDSDSDSDSDSNSDSNSIWNKKKDNNNMVELGYRETKSSFSVRNKIFSGFDRATIEYDLKMNEYTISYHDNMCDSNSNSNSNISNKVVIGVGKKIRLQYTWHRQHYNHIFNMYNRNNDWNCSNNCSNIVQSICKSGVQTRAKAKQEMLIKKQRKRQMLINWNEWIKGFVYALSKDKIWCMMTNFNQTKFFQFVHCDWQPCLIPVLIEDIRLGNVEIQTL